ncbi:uncharacterized protein LOC114258571 [Camellia sinensis]|uniref:uncharacterized protein LOC114258571 n=1 Tax=Camellia sinensis TaxID=4442 RepID=UPI001035A1BC|nr:uncharacterized protein LOC114258571 [Camellia sinensis]
MDEWTAAQIHLLGEVPPLARLGFVRYSWFEVQFRVQPALTEEALMTQEAVEHCGSTLTFPGNRKFFIAATDYFTKWVEADSLATIREKDVKKFVWKNVITRFGISKALISDNGAQFDGKLFRGFCEELKIEFYNSTPAYTQSNGQAEASNKTILDGLKKRLEKAKGKRAEELPNVLWAYRTTPRRSTEETPFALAYGMEAVIPLEIGMPTIRSESFQPDLNSETVALELDLAEERRERALIHIAAYQQELSKKYNKAVHPRMFKIGDWVLRKVLGNTVVPGEGKLGANWEGPYKTFSLLALNVKDSNAFVMKNSPLVVWNYVFVQWIRKDARQL